MSEPKPEQSGGAVIYFLGLLLSVWRPLAAIVLLLAAATTVFCIFDGLGLCEAMYLTLITFLTIGYGDLAPASGIARFSCIIVGFSGFIFMGIVVGATIKTFERD
jgi:voltage-gated potassium channel